MVYIVLTLDILIGWEGHEAALVAIGQCVAFGNQKLTDLIIEECIHAAALRHSNYLQWNVGILCGQNAAKRETEVRGEKKKEYGLVNCSIVCVISLETTTIFVYLVLQRAKAIFE